MSIDDALMSIQERGWVRVPSVYSDDEVERIKDSFQLIQEEFIAIQKKKRISDLVENATHHTLILCREMLDLLVENDVSHILTEYFGGKFILNTMGLSIIPPRDSVYTQRIHRDVRSNTGTARLWINTLIMLDDSTEENGATWMLEGSQSMSEKPDSDYFYQNAVRALGKKGDVLIFDGNIWHSAGENTTQSPRHIITPIYSRPFIKQQLDYPRAFGFDFGRTLPPYQRQILGYNALTPVTLEEFYQPDEDRFYKSDQG